MSNPSRSLPRFVRVHLELGRVSNLPTIWSNCLAAWALATGGFLPTLWIVVAAITVIYVGGMYWNDACDAPWDAEHANDRPIVRGEIGRPTVYVLGTLFIVAGLALIWMEGPNSFIMGLLLVATIVAYDLYHKKIVWSPFLLAACRGLVYVTILVADAASPNRQLFLWAGAMAAYVLGLSYVAKVEETNILRRYSPLLLIFVPAALNFYDLGESQFIMSPTRIVLCALYLGWMGYCLVFVFWPGRRLFRKAVGGMLAGICLVDVMAVSQVEEPFVWQLACMALFSLAVLSQRKIPAT